MCFVWVLLPETCAQSSTLALLDVCFLFACFLGVDREGCSPLGGLRNWERLGSSLEVREHLWLSMGTGSLVSVLINGAFGVDIRLCRDLLFQGGHRLQRLHFVPNGKRTLWPECK